MACFLLPPFPVSSTVSQQDITSTACADCQLIILLPQLPKCVFFSLQIWFLEQRVLHVEDAVSFLLNTAFETALLSISKYSIHYVGKC